MAKKLKILQINKFFFLKGGSEKYFFDLSDLLVEKGHKVIPWSMEHPQNLFFPESENFAPYLDFFEKDNFFSRIKNFIRIFWNKKSQLALEEVIKKDNPDVAHIHNFLTHLSPSIIYTLKKHKIPIVMTLHDYKLFCPNHKFFSKNKTCFDCLNGSFFTSCIKNKCIHDSLIPSIVGFLEANWQKYILKIENKIDYFIAPSLFIKDKAIEAGVSENKISYIPNFLDKSFQVKNKTISDQLLENYFLYFGRLNKEKGIDMLIKTFLDLSKEIPGWKLKIAGEGPKEEKVKTISRNNKEVEFLGKKPKRELRDLIKKSYAVIIPSLWPENLPYAVLESFALEKPVIASDEGGLSELINHKENGLLFKPKKINLLENVKWAINNPEKIKRMNRFTQKNLFKKYNQEKHYKEILKIYERIKNN